MNERIKKLAEQAGMNIKTNISGVGLVFGTFEGYKTSHISVEELEKFAELIAKERKHQWQGLTGEELRNIAREFKGNTQRRFEDHWDEIVAFVREAEAKLKEKNGG